MIRAVLFDMGGVLLHMANEAGIPRGEADEAGRAALLARLTEAGAPATPELLEALLFGPWREGYRRRYETQREEPWEPHVARLQARLGTELPAAELLGAWFGPYREKLAPYPAARGALERAQRRGLALGLCSNVALPGRFYRERLDRFGLLAPFGTTLFSYDAGSRKPAPAMLERALATLGVAPGEAVMVGDRQGSDVAAGRAAGVATIWMRYGRSGGPEPDVAIDSLAELDAALDGLGRP